MKKHRINFSIISITLVLVLIGGFGVAAETDENSSLDDREIRVKKKIVVTATKSEREVIDIPRAVILETPESYDNRSPVTALDALDDDIGIWTEIKTATTSDPVMRGVSGSNILALVDGNTVTTLWGEGGLATDDLYGKIDSEWIDRIEVVRGPSSVLYGSNCLGGVINFITESSPVNYTSEGLKMGVGGKIGYDTASQGQRYNLELFGASPKMKFILGGSYRDIGNYEGGRDFGLLDPTSGEDLNATAKIEFLPHEKHLFTFNYQHTDRDNIHRYYRPQQDNENDREALNLSYQGFQVTDFFHEYEFRFYYQFKEDRRDDYKNEKEGKAKTTTLQGHLRAVTKISDHSFTYGFQYQRDDGESPDDEQFTWTDWNTGVTTKDAPDSVWQNYGVYLQDEWNVTPKFDLIPAIRYDGFRFESDPDEYYQPAPGQSRELDRIDDTNNAFTGSLSALYKITDGWSMFANIGRGFRAWPPKFGITQHGYGIVVPSELPDPATSMSYELGMKSSGRYSYSNLTLFYTTFDGFPKISPAPFQGQDWYDYDGDGERDPDEDTYIIESGVEAYIYGVETNGKLNLKALHQGISPQWYVKGGFSWNYAQDTTNDEPFRHGTPPRGLFSIGWESQGAREIWWEFTTEMVGKWDRIPEDRLNNDVAYRVDPQDKTSPLIRPYGLPGYTVFDVRGGLRLNDNMSLKLAVENIANKKFRRAHSRMDDPGTNIRATLAFSY